MSGVSGGSAHLLPLLPKRQVFPRLGIAAPSPQPSRPIIPAPKQPSWGTFGCAQRALSRPSKMALTSEVRSPEFHV